MDSFPPPLTGALGPVWGSPGGSGVLPQLWRLSEKRGAPPLMTEGNPPPKLLPLHLEADLESESPC